MVCIKQEIRFPEPPSLNSSELEQAKGECVKDLEGRNEECQAPVQFVMLWLLC